MTHRVILLKKYLKETLASLPKTVIWPLKLVFLNPYNRSMPSFSPLPLSGQKRARIREGEGEREREGHRVDWERERGEERDSRGKSRRKT